MTYKTKKTKKKKKKRKIHLFFQGLYVRNNDRFDTYFQPENYFPIIISII